MPYIDTPTTFRPSSMSAGLLCCLGLALVALACTPQSPQEERQSPTASTVSTTPQQADVPAGVTGNTPKGLDFVLLDIDTATASDCSSSDYPNAKRIDVKPTMAELVCDPSDPPGPCNPTGRQLLFSVHNLSPNQRVQFEVKDQADANAGMFTPPDITGGKAQACEHFVGAPWLCPAALSGVPQTPTLDNNNEAKWEYRVLVREQGPNGPVVACADPIILVTMAGNQ